MGPVYSSLFSVYFIDGGGCRPTHAHNLYLGIIYMRRAFCTLVLSLIYVYAVEVSVLSTTPNSVTLTWSEADIVTHSNMMIRWERNSPCSFEDTNITAMPISAPASNITIGELEEYSSYSITVSIGNSQISDTIIAVTNESGNLLWGEST